MPRNVVYACSECGAVVPRDGITVRKIQFYTIGAPNIVGNTHPPSKLLRSRTDKWLCSECLPKDLVWQRPPFSGPGSRIHPNQTQYNATIPPSKEELEIERKAVTDRLAFLDDLIKNQTPLFDAAP